MKIRKEYLDACKDAIKSTFITLFIFSPLFCFVISVIIGSGIFLGGLEGLSMTPTDCGNALKIMVPLMMIYLPIWYKIAFKVMDKDERKRAQEKKERVQRLEVQYSDYVSMVYSVAKEDYKHLLDSLETKDYLITFEDNLNRLCRYRNIEFPNSFIVATCLMYSLIYVGEVQNVEFAMKCAFSVISEPVMYYCKDGEWEEKICPKVDILLPDDLFNSINKTIEEEYKARNTSMMQMANLLHLIYLNSGGHY